MPITPDISNIPKFRSQENLEYIVGKENLFKLHSLVEAFATKLKTEGIAVTSDCRIDMDSFKDIYPPEEIKRDKEYIQKIKSRFNQTEENFGDPIELLVTIIWNKILGKKLVAVRTTIFDDIKNKVDHLIIERDTGKIICFIDSVASLTTQTTENKKNKTGLVKNIKYGLTIKNEEITLTKLNNIPVFYIGTPLTQLKNLVPNLTDSIDSDPSETEKKLMDFYLKILAKQIEEHHLNNVAENLLKLIPDVIKKEIIAFLNKK